MSQIAALTVKASTAAPALDQALKEAKPTPEPTAIRINDAETATNAPARIAGQDAAGCDVTALMAASLGAANTPSFMSADMSAMRTHGEQQDHRQRHTEHPEQNSTTHFCYSLYER
jgi:hypothetical protein